MGFTDRRLAIAVIVTAAATGACGRLGFDETETETGAGGASVGGIPDDKADDGIPNDGIPDLVVRYAMDDDPTTGAIVSSDADYDGTCDVCPTSIAGPRGAAYAFDGTQWIDLPAASASLVGASRYTVSVWIRTRVAPEKATVVAKPLDLVGNRNPFKLHSTPAADGFVFETTSGVDIEALDDTADLLDTWHHVALTWDGALKRSYLDGAPRGSQTPSAEVDSALPLEIGAELDFGEQNNFFFGDIDELRFYSRALSENEIALLAR